MIARVKRRKFNRIFQKEVRAMYVFATPTIRTSHVSTLITRTSLTNSAVTQLNVFSAGVFSLKNRTQNLSLYPRPKKHCCCSLLYTHAQSIFLHSFLTMTFSYFHHRPKAYWRCHHAMHRLNVILSKTVICFTLNLTRVVVIRSTLILFTTINKQTLP